MKNTDSKNLVERPPIVVIMGHIDHGKSTLLDYIQKTRVVEGEAGGITQHVSAYEATVDLKPNGSVKKKITFIDTPGHESFSTMRECGATIADIAILIISAEEGVKAQTIEAYKTIARCGLPFIVAINKIDRPNADANKVKQQLAEQDVMVEGYGGKIPCAEISAKEGTGVDELLDLILLTAELEEYKMDPLAEAEGFVLEAKVDHRAGTIATLIIKNGTLEPNNWLTIGPNATKIKRLSDFSGQVVKKLSASSPAIVLGFSELPPNGAAFHAFGDRAAAEKFASQQKKEQLLKSGTDPENETASGEALEIPVVIKTDVSGTAEAVVKEIKKYKNDRARIKIVHSGVGKISEGDVQLAAPIVIGFNVRVDKSAKDLAEKNNIEIRTFDVIYHLSEWLEEAVKARLPKIVERSVTGRARLLKLFGENRNKQIIGGTVENGEISEGQKVIIKRREAELGEGRIAELQHQKVRAKKVESGKQFGALIEAKVGLAEGDYLEPFELIEK